MKEDIEIQEEDMERKYKYTISKIDDVLQESRIALDSRKLGSSSKLIRNASELVEDTSYLFDDVLFLAFSAYQLVKDDVSAKRRKILVKKANDFSKRAIMLSVSMKRLLSLARTGDVSELMGDTYHLASDVCEFLKDTSSLVKDASRLMKETIPRDKSKELFEITERIEKRVTNLEEKVQNAATPKDASGLVSDASKMIKDASGLVSDASDLLVTRRGYRPPSARIGKKKARRLIWRKESRKPKKREQPVRFTDLAFYEKDIMVERGHTLKADHWYRLIVSIREEPIGMPTEGKKLPIHEPKQDRDVTLYVTAEGDGFEIKNPVDTLILPPKGDSKTNAEFSVRPERKTSSPNDRATIRVRVYYKFNLLEVGRIKAEVVGKFEDDTHSQLRLEEPITFASERTEGDFDIDIANIYPREMHIDITRKNNVYFFSFAFWNDANKNVEFSKVPTKLSDGELEDLLVRLRKKLWRIVMSEMYGRELKGDKIEFARQMNDLAHFGWKLWIRLFRKSSGSSLRDIGEWLEEHPLKKGAVIQVSVGDGAETFIFPWNLVYDKKYPDNKNELPDLEGFWGLHYVIEQRLPMHKWQSLNSNRDAPFDLDEGFEIAFMLWPFLYAPEQEAFIRDLAAHYHGEMTNGEPIVSAKEAYDVLTNCVSHILYFYTHGYTRPREADIGGLDLVKLYEEEPEKSSIRQDEVWRKLYIQARESEEDSFIELRHGKLTLDRLRYEVETLPKYPIVFLNMCESAQATPSLSGSFIDFFIDRGARCVIGTECSMRPLFAHHFSKGFFEALLAGATVGEALLHVRSEFMKLHNPLGLAYTLFGTATARFIQLEDTKNETERKNMVESVTPTTIHPTLR